MAGCQDRKRAAPFIPPELAALDAQSWNRMAQWLCHRGLDCRDFADHRRLCVGRNVGRIVVGGRGRLQSLGEEKDHSNASASITSESARSRSASRHVEKGNHRPGTAVRRAQSPSDHDARHHAEVDVLQVGLHRLEIGARARLGEHVGDGAAGQQAGVAEQRGRIVEG